MPPLDEARLARVMARLDPTDAAWLSEMLEPASLARQRRLGLRDEALRRLAALTAETRPTVLAKGIARDLTRYLAAGWPAERGLSELPASSGPRRVLLHQIARLNGGSPLQWRAITGALQRTMDAPATETAECAAHADAQSKAITAA